jgi:hypothetical protein
MERQGRETMMGGEILRPQDFDQVLFLGENSIRLVEFRLLIPQQGSSNYSTIIYGEPRFIGGILKDEKVAMSIENNRILNNSVLIRGRRVLVVLADLDAVDKNRSILDFAISDMMQQVDQLKKQKEFLESESMLTDQFMKEKHLESTWEEWMQNKLELLRVAQKKTSDKGEGSPPVSVEVGEQKKKG